MSKVTGFRRDKEHKLQCNFCNYTLLKMEPEFHLKHCDAFKPYRDDAEKIRILMEALEEIHQDKHWEYTKDPHDEMRFKYAWYTMTCKASAALNKVKGLEG